MRRPEVLISNNGLQNMTIAKRLSVMQFFLGAVIASAVIGALTGIASAHSSLGVSVDIDANGGTLVRSAEVTAVSESQVNAETSWGSAILNWVVKTDAETDYVNKNNKEIARSDIQVGDTISFKGTIEQAISGLTVKAKTVKDWSKTEAKTKLEGFVSSINTSLNSFVIVNGNSTTTIETDSSTEFSDKNGDATFADLFMNAKVKLRGLWNASSSIFTATDVEIASPKKHGWTGEKRDFRDWIRSKVWFGFVAND